MDSAWPEAALADLDRRRSPGATVLAIGWNTFERSLVGAYARWLHARGTVVHYHSTQVSLENGALYPATRADTESHHRLGLAAAALLKSEAFPDDLLGRDVDVAETVRGVMRRIREMVPGSCLIVDSIEFVADDLFWPAGNVPEMLVRVIANYAIERGVCVFVIAHLPDDYATLTSSAMREQLPAVFWAGDRLVVASDDLPGGSSGRAAVPPDGDPAAMVEVSPIDVAARRARICIDRSVDSSDCDQLVEEVAALFPGAERTVGVWRSRAGGRNVVWYHMHLGEHAVAAPLAAAIKCIDPSAVNCASPGDVAGTDYDIVFAIYAPRVKTHLIDAMVFGFRNA